MISLHSSRLYIIDKDGDMFQCVEINYGTIHAKGLVASFIATYLILAQCQMKLERMEKW